MKWFSKKSNLDEMQELKLLKIESRGFWIGFLALFLAIMAQIFLFGQEFADHTLGELTTLLCMALYLIGGCLRNGIWDRHLQATPAANISLSLLAGALTGLFNAIVSYRNYQSAAGAIAVFVVFFLLVGVVLSAVLCFCSALYHKRRKQLELEEEESGNGKD